MPARSLPEEDRWKLGCDGRPGASDMREPDTERTWEAVVVCGACWLIVAADVERFMADAGIGMAETL